MADGRIKIAIEVDGKQVNVAAKELRNLEKTGQQTGKGVKSTEDGLKGVGKESNKASIDIKKLAKALGLVAIGVAAFRELKNAVSDAIKRFDTLNNFPKVLQSLGVSAEDSERAIQKLSDGIDGLPTKLDDIAATAQRMYTSFNDIDKATDTALALNNALLGSGASAADAQRGTEQYLQALQKGKFEMEEWKTLQETMDVGLVKIAESFGYTGRSAKQDLYQALKDGVITMDQFNDKLIEIGTGTGIMATLARENSLGIATSLQNLRTAAARGLADIIASINRLSQRLTGRDIAQNIDRLKVFINRSFKAIGRAIEASEPYIKSFINLIKATISVAQTLSPVIIGLMASYASYQVVTKASAAIKASNEILRAAMTSAQGLTLAIHAQTAATVTSTTATHAQTVALAAQTGTVKLSTLAIGVMTGAIKASTAAKIVATAAAKALGAAWRFLTGPIGWIVAGIGLLVTGITALVKWFRRKTAEAEKLSNKNKELEDSIKSLNEEVSNSASEYKKARTEINSNAKASRDLAKRIDELASKEKKSAADKRLLASYVDQLNQSVHGLNLTYNEEKDALSLSSQQIKERISLMQQQQTAQEAQERLVEILRQQAEAEEKLAETIKLREEWNKKFEEGAVKSREYQDAVAELNEKEQKLKGTLEELATQQDITENQIASSMQKITEAIQRGVSLQTIAYDDLTEAQKKAVDDMRSTWQEYKDDATNMFDTLSDKSELTVAEMTKNLQENQRIISEWADGIATLAERGLDQGLLDKLREAGPQSAGHVKELVNASDEELQKLNDAFRKGGETATDALEKALGLENTGIIESIGHLVTTAEQTLRERIQAANFQSIGMAVPDGTAKGIEENSKKAEDASKKMADGTTNAAKRAFGIQSPSRVFRQIGVYLADGVALGLTQGSAKIIQAITRMFRSVQANASSSFRQIAREFDSGVLLIERSFNKLPILVANAMKKLTNQMKSESRNQLNAMKENAKDLPKPYNNLESRFNTIGKDAMRGLTKGLNSGGAKAIATARRIANEITKTMKNALQIKSPSRVMRDEIGRWIPAGIAEGIEKNAGIVEGALNRLSSKMIVARPEQAIKAFRMAYSSGGYQSSSGISSITNNNQRTFAPNITNYFTPAESTPSEVVKKETQMLQRLAMKWG